jgi:hypothetical protein
MDHTATSAAMVMPVQPKAKRNNKLLLNRRPAGKLRGKCCDTISSKKIYQAVCYFGQDTQDEEEQPNGDNGNSNTKAELAPPIDRSTGDLEVEDSVQTVKMKANLLQL